MVILYGLGTTIGAGIYALTGEVAGEAGYQAPLAFLLSALLAAATAFSFAELASRYPKSAGEALYVFRGFDYRPLATAVGLLVVTVGIISPAALLRGISNHLGTLSPLPESLMIGLLVALFCGLVCWGITESVVVASAVTLIEIGGLLVIIWLARGNLLQLPQTPLLPHSVAAWQGIGSGALLAFYAFLGFEDMVNVAEEVRKVRRTLPLAILVTLTLTTLLYTTLALVAVTTVTPTELAQSSAPLTLVYERAGGHHGGVISLIGILAMANGALIQMIMASRVLYGLASQGALPAWLGRVHPRRQTPIAATVSISLPVLLLALWFPLATLAGTTSLIALTTFSLCNLALYRVKKRDPNPPGIWKVPVWLPLTGFLVSTSFLLYSLTNRIMG